MSMVCFYGDFIYIYYICAGIEFVDLTVKERQFTNMGRVLKHAFAYDRVKSSW